MPGPYGLLITGFALKPESAVRDDLDAGCRDAFGPSVPLGPNTVLGEYNGIVAAAVAEVWELAQAVDSSEDPDTATGVSLEQVCALTGTRRDEAAPSTVTLTLTGDPATPVTTGSRAGSATVAATQFETTEDVVFAPLSAWDDATVYFAGQRVYYTDAGVDRAYQCTIGGTSETGAGNGPVDEDEVVVDNTVTWRFLGRGTAVADAASQCTEDGPTVATSGDITEIITPVSGWLGVKNLLDADLGANEESDGHLRLKREEELQADDAAVPDAIREGLLKPLAEGGTVGATSATVFFNPTDVTDADGVPPHSVECLVRGGDDQDIFDYLLAHVAAGIGTFGTEAGTAFDSEGNEHDENFSRPDEKEIYVEVTLTYDAAKYPADGDDQVKAAIVAFGDAFPTGRDAVAVAIGAQAFTVPGVLDVPRSGSLGGTLISLAPGPTTDTTIAIALRELATFDSSRITVASTPGTP